MEQHQKTQALYQRALSVTPGGVHSNVRRISEPLPLFYTHGRGSHVWDADGNEYIDYVLGQGPLLLGHTPENVIAAIHRQAGRGLVFAGQSELEVRAAELIVEHVPCAEMVRFNASGSEANHAALRLARAATGRKKILRFEGHYHGWHDNIAWCPATRNVQLGPREAPLLRPSSAGQQPEDALNLVVRPWNDLPLLDQLFKERGNDLAAVICDPFACACGLIPARPEFLHALRALCNQYGVQLIFDEVITGFRVALGGAQAYYGITPDLATFAKALGGGVGVAAVAGRAELMQLFAEAVNHAGTYNGNPLAMAATVAAIETLARDGGAELEKAHAQGRALWHGLEQLAQVHSVPLQLRGVPAVFSTSFVPPEAPPVTDFRTSLAADADILERLWRTMQQRGVQFTSFGIWFLSTVHDRTDINQTLEAVEQCMKELTRA